MLLELHLISSLSRGSWGGSKGCLPAAATRSPLLAPRREPAGRRPLERLAPGAAIKLQGPEGSVVVATTATSVSGECFFESALPGNYALVEEQPAGCASALGFDRGAGDAGGPGGGDDGSLPSNKTSVALASGEGDFGNDFVESRPGRISGGVTELAPAGEAGAEGAAIRLQGPKDNVVVATTETNVSGECFFESVTPGECKVVEEGPGGLASASDFDRSANGEKRPRRSACSRSGSGQRDFGDAQAGRRRRGQQLR